MIAKTEFKEIKMTNNWADIMEEEEGFSITYNQPCVSSFEVKKL